MDKQGFLNSLAFFIEALVKALVLLDNADFLKVENAPALLSPT